MEEKNYPSTIFIFMIDFDDNGPGIEPEVVKTVLEPFYSTKSNGTGLGLSVVNSVVAAHKGKLNLTKSPLGGLRVSMEFPHD